jgi:Predicted glycosylase
MPYEQLNANLHIIFPCGSVIINDDIFIYYGGADHVICVGKISMKNILEILKV